jgi:hypothetical protein
VEGHYFQQPISNPEYAIPGEEEIDLFDLLDPEPQLMGLLNSDWGQSLGND